MLYRVFFNGIQSVVTSLPVNFLICCMTENVYDHPLSVCPVFLNLEPPDQF